MSPEAKVAFKAKVLEKVQPGIKGTELIAELGSLVWGGQGDLTTDPEEIGIIVDEMVACGEILEVEYVLPHMSYRIKSLYFPTGTQITIGLVGITGS